MSSRTIFVKNCPTERNRGEKNCLNERNRDEKKSSPEGGGVAPIRIITRCDKKLSKRFFGISSKMVSAHPHVSLFF